MTDDCQRRVMNEKHHFAMKTDDHMLVTTKNHMLYSMRHFRPVTLLCETIYDIIEYYPNPSLWGQRFWVSNHLSAPPPRSSLLRTDRWW